MRRFTPRAHDVLQMLGGALASVCVGALTEAAWGGLTFGLLLLAFGVAKERS